MWADQVGSTGTIEQTTNVTSQTISLGATATVGNFLLSTATWDKAAGATPTCEDSSGVDAWTVTYVEASDGNSSTAIAHKIADGDETQCFWSWSNSQQICGQISEWEGPWEASPLDQTDTFEDATPRNDVPLGPTGTLSQADEFCVAAAGWDSALPAVTLSYDNSFTELVELNETAGDTEHGCATKVVSSTSAVSVTCTRSSATDECTGILQTFKMAAAAGGIEILRRRLEGHA